MSLEIQFCEHPVFEKKFKKFCKKHSNAPLAYKHLKKLLLIHFHPFKNQTVFTPKILKRINRVGPNVEVFKVILAIKGLKQGSCPRVCFWKEGYLITFLCFGTHIENYKDFELRILVQKYIKDMKPSIQFKEV